MTYSKTPPFPQRINPHPTRALLTLPLSLSPILLLNPLFTSFPPVSHPCTHISPSSPSHPSPSIAPCTTHATSPSSLPSNISFSHALGQPHVATLQTNHFSIPCAFNSPAVRNVRTAVFRAEEPFVSRRVTISGMDFPEKRCEKMVVSRTRW